MTTAISPYPNTHDTLDVTVFFPRHIDTGLLATPDEVRAYALHTIAHDQRILTNALRNDVLASLIQLTSHAHIAVLHDLSTEQRSTETLTEDEKEHISAAVAEIVHDVLTAPGTVHVNEHTGEAHIDEIVFPHHTPSRNARIMTCLDTLKIFPAPTYIDDTCYRSNTYRLPGQAIVAHSASEDIAAKKMHNIATQPRRVHANAAGVLYNIEAHLPEESYLQHCENPEAFAQALAQTCNDAGVPLNITITATRPY